MEGNTDFIASGADNEDIEDVVEALDEFEEIDTAEEKETEQNTLFTNPIESLLKFHPECILDYEEDEQPSIPLRTTLSENDPVHRSMPFLSIFEKTKIIGMRTNQLAQGARPYIIVPDHITSVQEIAKLELEQRKLPIIIKRHMPDGTYEKFRLSDMIII
jgi:DNA-directed RNA polymerase I, II, and III subunit RPABC2